MNHIHIAKEIRSAIKLGNTERVVELVGNDIERLNMMTPFGTWLHVASSKGRLEIVKQLIALGADVNQNGGVYGGGAINEAALGGHIDIVAYLLSCGAKMDVTEPERNPLFGAISNGHVDIAELLIKSGIDSSVKYSDDRDALAFARELGQTEVVALIENMNGSNSNGTNYDNQNQHDKILEHVTKYFGSPITTIGEIIPGSRVGIHIHIIPPSKENHFITLVTTGMSDYPMDNSEEASEFKYAELIQKLPVDWPIKKEDLKDQNMYWPLGWLRKTAHIPHAYDGWLTEGVILPNGEPPQPFASRTKLSCIMVCKVQEKGLEKLVTPQDDLINFYTLVPIYEEERTLALEKGYKYLLNKMNEKGITDILDTKRVNVGV
ncbi:suppressor of fused domain protein [Bacillus bingmayongensis]|uniref:suppressor of fused domain protein n=1 Tax=Bacillus bingmayongensis TaxID=1150157 RepID=UPI0002E8E17B|nr:suppressor of fused domain protein [Bacillus bingmayongensis]MBY0599706.1 suppressor of fused domain protein [Bacillus bingmayongensis]